MKHSFDTKRALVSTLIAQQQENYKKVPRKRSWRASEKAMASAEYLKRIEVFEQILDDLNRLEGLED